MVLYRLVAALSAAVLGVAPSTTPTPAPPAASPSYLPCPIAPAALAVKTPQSTLPPPSPSDPSRPPVGGGGLATTGLAVAPEAPALPTAVLGARAWLVADLDTGAVLAACGPHERYAPASVQKLLLAATLLAQLDPAQVIEITRDDLNIERGSSAVGLVTGGRYAVETLWLGLLLVSGNDAANALARLGGGDAGVPGTLRAMNDLAHRLGARDTNALTPHGLDAPGQFTSVYDLALIARVCFANADFRRYALTQTAQIPPQPPKYPSGFQIQNENKLIAQYPGALGGKTGFTNNARHSYVGAAERNGRRLVVTMLGAEAVPQRPIPQAQALLDWGFSVPAGTGVGRLVEPGELDRPPSPSVRAAPRRQGFVDAAGAGDWRAWAMIGIGLTIVMIAVSLLAVVRARRARRRARSARPDRIAPERIAPERGRPSPPPSRYEYSSYDGSYDGPSIEW